jgi:hypothetical protein
MRLHLEQLEEFRTFVGGRHELQLAVGVGEQQSRGSGPDELRCAGRDHLQELDEVELHDESVGELHEHLRNAFRGQRAHHPLPLMAPG